MRKLTQLVEAQGINDSDYLDISQLEDGRYISRKVSFTTLSNNIKIKTLVDVDDKLDSINNKLDAITNTTTTTDNTDNTETTTTTTTDNIEITTTTTTNIAPIIIQEKDTVYECRYECDDIRSREEQICCMMKGKPQHLYPLLAMRF